MPTTTRQESTGSIGFREDPRAHQKNIQNLIRKNYSMPRVLLRGARPQPFLHHIFVLSSSQSVWSLLECVVKKSLRHRHVRHQSMDELFLDKDLRLKGKLGKGQQYWISYQRRELIFTLCFCLSAFHYFQPSFILFFKHEKADNVISHEYKLKKNAFR